MKLKKLLSGFLALAMVLGAALPTARAAEEQGTEGVHCTHTAHDEACGYMEEVKGSPCTHVHDETCGYAPATEASPCTHVHDALCGYAAPTEGRPCVHVHDGTCGYVLAPPGGRPCTYVHVHNAACGYVEAVAEVPCTCGALPSAPAGAPAANGAGPVVTGGVQILSSKVPILTAAPPTVTGGTTGETGGAQGEPEGTTAETGVDQDGDGATTEGDVTPPAEPVTPPAETITPPAETVTPPAEPVTNPDVPGGTSDGTGTPPDTTGGTTDGTGTPPAGTGAAPGGAVVHAPGCPYRPAVEGRPCNDVHVHDETCGYIPPCKHVHDAACGYSPVTGTCAHVHDETCCTLLSPCTHVHDAACGYAAPTQGTACTHVHDAVCGYAVPAEEVPCTHVHDGTCGYVEAVAGHPCGHVCSVESGCLEAPAPIHASAGAFSQEELDRIYSMGYFEDTEEMLTALDGYLEEATPSEILATLYMDHPTTLELAAAPVLDVRIENPPEAIQVNPYNIQINGKTDSIITTPCVIKNYTEAEVEVTAVASGTATGGVTLVGESTRSGKAPGGKDMFLFLEMKTGTSDNFDGADWKTAASFTGNYQEEGESPSAAGVLIPGVGNSQPATITMAAGSETNPSYAAFKIGGDCSAPAYYGEWQDTTTVGGWVDGQWVTTPVPGDGANITIVFTFTPLVGKCTVKFAMQDGYGKTITSNYPVQFFVDGKDVTTVTNEVQVGADFVFTVRTANGLGIPEENMAPSVKYSDYPYCLLSGKVMDELGQNEPYIFMVFYRRDGKSKILYQWTLSDKIPMACTFRIPANTFSAGEEITIWSRIQFYG